AAKKEGHLNVIALPHDWANYGQMISAFKKKYGLGMTEDNPNGSSAQENQAIRSLKDDSRAPDVVDVGPSFAIAGADEALYKPGNFIPVDGTQQPVAAGQTPIVIDWDYLILADKKEFPAVHWTTVIPSDGVYGSFYCQAINASAPHPNAAKLWMEFLYSDQGQLIWLKGYSHPARFQDLAKHKKIPAALIKALPSPKLYAKVRFASDA